MLKKDDAKNIDFLVAKKEIKARFEKILTDLRKTVEGNGYAVQMVGRFRGCLENPENNDADRLPFYASTLFSHYKTKIFCVICMVSYTVQLHWEFCAGGDQGVKNLLDSCLDRLENYAAKGLAAFKIVGDKYPDGFYLEEIK